MHEQVWYAYTGKTATHMLCENLLSECNLTTCTLRFPHLSQEGMQGRTIVVTSFRVHILHIANLVVCALEVFTFQYLYVK